MVEALTLGLGLWLGRKYCDGSWLVRRLLTRFGCTWIPILVPFASVGTRVQHNSSESLASEKTRLAKSRDNSNLETSVGETFASLSSAADCSEQRIATHTNAQRNEQTVTRVSRTCQGDVLAVLERDGPVESCGNRQSELRSKSTVRGREVNKNQSLLPRCLTSYCYLHPANHHHSVLLFALRIATADKGRGSPTCLRCAPNLHDAGPCSRRSGARKRTTIDVILVEQLELLATFVGRNRIGEK